MGPPSAETLEQARRRQNTVRIAALVREGERIEYDRRIAAKRTREEYVRAQMACPICDRPSNGTVCATCLHHEAVATRDLLEGYE